MEPEKFITAFTSARHLSLSWARSIQSMSSYTASWGSILILSSHLHLGLPSGLFPSGFPTKTIYTTPFFPIRSTWPAHRILLDIITRTIFGEQYTSLSSSLCSFLHSPVTSSLLAPNLQPRTVIFNYIIYPCFYPVTKQPLYIIYTVTMQPLYIIYPVTK